MTCLKTSHLPAHLAGLLSPELEIFCMPQSISSLSMAASVSMSGLCYTAAECEYLQRDFSNTEVLSLFCSLILTYCYEFTVEKEKKQKIGTRIFL